MKYLFILFVFNSLCGAQTTELKSIKPDTLWLKQDQMSNWYGVKNNVLILKKNAKIYTYANLNKGKLTAIDVYNPLQLLLFYKNNNGVVILDNQLNELFKLNNYDGIFENIGTASQNEFWFYDSLCQKFGLYNWQKQNMKWLSTVLPVQFLYHTSNYNFYYWVNHNFELYKIDKFGNIKYLYVLPQTNSYEMVNEQNWILINEKEVFQYNYVSKEKVLIHSSKETIRNHCYNDGKLIIFTDTNQIQLNFNSK